MEETTNIATAPAATSAPASGARPTWGTGRRKTAIARVRVLPGNGKIEINGRELDHYFLEPEERNAVREPLVTANAVTSWDVLVNVHGGGHSGQSIAIRLGVARAMIKVDQKCEASLRDAGLLTRDSRIVERKKFGRRKARRRYQFSKR